MWLLESLSSYELEGGPHSMNKILLLDYLIYAADDVSSLCSMYIHSFLLLLVKIETAYWYHMYSLNGMRVYDVN